MRRNEQVARIFEMFRKRQQPRVGALRGPYVVRSFNADKPYDRFVKEQIAADEIWPDNRDLDPRRVYSVNHEKKRHLEARIGTGLYGLGPCVPESTLDARPLHYETLTDRADTPGAVFVGLTLRCARCHDHKFDPLTQEDYVALQAIFTSSVEVEEPITSSVEIISWQDRYPLLVGVHEARVAYKLWRDR